MFAVPTIALHGLHQPDDTKVTTKPDVTLHEARKFCSLALGCNPTVMELVWLPDDLYEVRTPLGNELIEFRKAFLSQKRVRDAYLGYATQQFKRLSDRGDGSFSADTRRRTAKHARHLLRLCHQGLRLYAFGVLEVRLEDPDRFREFGERVAGGDIAHAERAMSDYEDAFRASVPAIPARPDEAPVERWLQVARWVHWHPGTEPETVP